MNTILFLSLVSLGADPEPQLQFEKTSVDRGEIKSGVPLIETFKLKNANAHSITIVSLTGSCGCLKPTISSQVILPGESAEIQFEVNTLTQPPGPNRWKLALRYRLENGKEIDQALELTASITREVKIEPAALIVVTTEAMRRDITVASSANKPIIANRVTSSTPHLTAKLLTETASPANTQVVRVEFDSDAPAGDHQGFVSIFTNDPDHAEIRVPIQIIKRSPKEVQASPDELSLRLATDQRTASGIIRLKDGQGREVLVEKAEADHPALSTKHVPGPGKMSTLRITVNVDSESRRGEGIVRVTLKSPEAKTVSIPVRWE